MSVWVKVHVCAQVCRGQQANYWLSLCVCADACVCTGVWRPTSGVTIIIHFGFETVAWGLPIQLDELASNLQGITSLHGNRITWAHRHAWLFDMASRE